MGNIDLLEDACAKLAYTKRAMFGGFGLFAPNGGMFAGIVDDDRIVLKFVEDAPEHAEFRTAGGAPWRYQDKMTMKEWLLVPEAMYDEPRALAECAAGAPAHVSGALNSRRKRRTRASRGARRSGSSRASGSGKRRLQRACRSASSVWRSVRSNSARARFCSRAASASKRRSTTSSVNA